MAEEMKLNVSASHDTSHYDKCRTLLQEFRKRHLRRALATVVLCLINGYIHIIPMPMIRGTETAMVWGMTGSGFAFGFLALLVTLGIIVLSFLGTQEKPQFQLGVLALLLLSLLLDLMQPVLVLLCVALSIWSLSESKKAIWLTKQPGYPYFNERFAEMLMSYGKAYQSQYDLKRKPEETMHALDAEKERDVVFSEPAQKPEFTGIPGAKIPTAEPVMTVPEIPAPLMDVKPPVVSAITELPGPAAASVPERKETEPVQEPEFPSGNDVSVPVWDVPDPVLDTAAVLSDFPEINGNIPDLPEVPDIPVL